MSMSTCRQIAPDKKDYTKPFIKVTRDDLSDSDMVQSIEHTELAVSKTTASIQCNTEKKNIFFSIMRCVHSLSR